MSTRRSTLRWPMGAPCEVACSPTEAWDMDRTTETTQRKPRLVGINHIALEVGSVEEALAFYGRIFDFTLRGKGKGAAFIDIGDQFIALMEGPVRTSRGHRHFGLVVDDRSSVRARVTAAGGELLDGPFLDFL